MSKFKAGDRVVVVRSNHPLQVSYLSERGEVKSVTQEGEYEVTVILDGMGCGTCFDSSELEFEHVYDELSKAPSDEDVVIGHEIAGAFFDKVMVDTRPDDVVNHPSHYAEGWSNGSEVIDITEHLNFNRGNAVKYLARAGKKGGPEKELEDLRKALWYVTREVARLGGESE